MNTEQKVKLCKFLSDIRRDISHSIITKGYSQEVSQIVLREILQIVSNEVFFEDLVFEETITGDKREFIVVEGENGNCDSCTYELFRTNTPRENYNFYINEILYDFFDPTVSEDLSTAKTLLDMISPQRYKDEHIWYSIGNTLYNITKGSREGLRLWIHMTKKNIMYLHIIPDYLRKAYTIPEKCYCVYHSFKHENLTVKTLA